MRLKWMMVLALGLVGAYVGAQEAQVLKTQKDKVSYSFGVDIVRNLKRQGIELDADLLVKGIRDALSGGNLLMTDDEIRKTIVTFLAEIKQKRTKARATLAKDAEENKREGEAFLAENRKKDGIVTLPSGLQYKIIKAGNGKKPTEADTVEVHYRGTLINGTEFDSSYRTDRPATFKVKGGIPCWREALTLMPVGSKWQLFVPSHLAYGERGAGPNIGPNETLIFEVELLAIK
jgi:FKBP-type peptidyl-prolyl cis-trans isomerase FklB